MKKLIGLCLLCLFGIVPGASAQFNGGDGDGYDEASLSTSFPQFLWQFTGGDGDGYDSSSALFRTSRYVDTTGNDAGNDCTNSADPCATIAHAVAQATPEDTIHLAAGTYNEPGLIIDKKLNIVGAGVIVE